MANKKTLFLKILLLYMVFQNIAAIFASNLGVVWGKAAILLKDFLLYFAVLLYLLSLSIRREKVAGRTLFDRKNVFDVLIYAYFIITAVYFILPYGNENFFIKGVSFRQLLIIPMLYVVGKLFQGVQLDYISRFIIKVGLLICIFSFAERFILGDAFWKSIGVYNYMSAKGFAPWAAPDGIASSFYTWDYMSFIKQGYGSVRRMVGIHGDAMLTAQFLVYPTFMLYLRFNPMARPLSSCYFFLFLAVIILTFSKGAVLMLLISVITFALFKYNVFKSFRAVWMVAALFGPVMLAGTLPKNNFSSIPTHFAGLASNLANLQYKPFGYGIGTLGNYAVVLTDRSLESSIGSGESYLGTMMGQIGIFAVIFYIIFVSLIYKKIGQMRNTAYQAFLIVFFALFCTATLSESAITYTGSGYLFLLMGMVSNDICKAGVPGGAI